MYNNAADEFDKGFGEFDSINPAPMKTRKPPRKKIGKGMLIAAAAGLVLVGVLLFLLLKKETAEERTITAGFSAPSGATETIDPGVRLLTNELLVSMGDGYGLTDLEKHLEGMDGAAVGYLAELNQYQVRFNTGSRAELDAKKNELASASEVKRVDYNFIIALETDENPGNTDVFFQGNGEKIGILGVLPAPDGGDSVLFLASREYADMAALTGAGLDDPAGRDTAAALASGRELIYASGFYYTQAPDGTLSRVTTTGALRYQIAALANAGAEVICIPQTAPVSSDPILDGEAEQAELLLNALAEKNSRLLICKAGRDMVTEALLYSGTGQRRTLPVVSCDVVPADSLDLSGNGRRVYRASGLLPEGAACAPGKDDAQAVLLAAAYAADKLKGDSGSQPEDVIQIARNGKKAVAWDQNGRVAGAVDGDMTAAQAGSAISAGTRVVTVYAEDEVSCLPLNGASLDGTAMPGGVLRIVGEDFTGNRTVRANGYQDGTAALSGAAENGIHVPLKRSSGSETGSIRGNVAFAGGNAAEGLRIRIRDTGTGEVWPEQDISASYNVKAYPGTYEVTILAHDRTPVTIRRVTVTAGTETEVQDVTVSVPSDLKGTASGMIKDAMNGEGLGQVTLRFYDGVNAAGDTQVLGETESGADGSYSVTLPGGMYTMKASKEGYADASMTVRAEGEISLPDQNLTITPLVPEGQVRIVLEWGASPSDLDSHLVNRSQNIHLYYGVSDKQIKAANGEVLVNLDVDDTSSYGPETTTILVQQTGTYEFYIHDYTNRERTAGTALAMSGATVTVYPGNGEPVVFRVPNQPGTLWKVFTMVNGVVTPANAMSYQSSPASVGE